MAKPSARMEWAEKGLMPTSNSHTTVPHHHKFGIDLVNSACWRPTRVWVAIHWCVIIFKLVVPLLNLCDTHSIITESRLNLPNGLHLAFAQFLEQFDAVALLQSFRHFPYNKNLTRALNTTWLKCCLLSPETIHSSCMHMKVQGCLM